MAILLGWGRGCGNTPLGSAFDAFGDVSVDVPCRSGGSTDDAWWTEASRTPDSAVACRLFGDAITWALDWVFAGFIRERLRLIDASRLAEHERAPGRAHINTGRSGYHRRA